jgi:hypothetical protein
VGPRWGCLTQDRPTRFIVAWSFGPSEDEAAPAAVAGTRERTAGRAGVPWVSDGRRVYRRTVARVYRDPVRTGRRGRPPLRRVPGAGLVQAVKHRSGHRLERVEVRVVQGAPVACPYTVHVERLNGVLRDRLACLTRKTHAFAKAAPAWDAVVTLALLEHNWLRPHPALRQRLPTPATPHGRRYARRSPAMAIGLTDHLWTWREFLTHPVRPYVRE